MLQRRLPALLLPCLALAQGSSEACTDTFPGTGEGLSLETGVGSMPPSAEDTKTASVGESLAIAIDSANPQLEGAALLLAYELVAPGAVPSPSLPGLAFDLAGNVSSASLGSLSSLAPASLQFSLPLGLADAGLLLQAVALPLDPSTTANGLFASSAGHRIDIAANAPLVLTEDVRITANDSVAGDNFGFDVALEGDLLAVGAPFDANISPDAGSAYTFDANTGAQLQRFTGPIFLGDNFGSSVLLRDGRLLVGAPREDFVAQLSGRIYVFDALSGAGVASLAPVGGGVSGPVGHSLGESMEISGDLLIAGTRGDTELVPGGGSAHLYDASDGSLIGKLFPDDSAFADNFGFSVGVSGQRSVVGRPFDDVNGPDSGSALLFDTQTGNQLQLFAPTDASADDLVGTTVAIEGDTVLVGAPFLDLPGGSFNEGAVYVYDASSGALRTRLISPQPSANGRFGDGLATSPAYLLIGESLGTSSRGVASGLIHVYDRVSLQRLFQLETSDGALGDALGESIAIDGQRVLAGARGADFLGELSGAAYLFSLP